MTMPRKPVRAKRPKRALESHGSKTDERRARSDKTGDQASLRMQDSPVASECVFPGSTTECDVYAGQLARTFPVDVTTPVAQCSSAIATQTPAVNSIAGIGQLPGRGSQVERHPGSRPQLHRPLTASSGRRCGSACTPAGWNFATRTTGWNAYPGSRGHLLSSRTRSHSLVPPSTKFRRLLHEILVNNAFDASWVNSTSAVSGIRLSIGPGVPVG